MSDDNSGAVPNERACCLPDKSFTFCIEVACCLVEDEDGWIFQDSPRNTHPLALAAGELNAALANERAISLLHFHNERMGEGSFRRLSYFLRGGAGLAVSDVFSDRPREEVYLLRHHRNLVAQTLLGDVAEVLAVDEQSPAVWVEGAEEKVDKCGLAAAGSADECHGGAGEDDHIDVLECKASILGVAEVHVLKADFFLEGRQSDGVGFVGHADGLVNEVEEPLHAANVAAEAGEEVRKTPQRRVSHVLEGDIEHKLTDRGLAPQDENTGEHDHTHAPYGGDYRLDVFYQCPEALRAVLGVAEACEEHAVLLRFYLLLGEFLDGEDVCGNVIALLRNLFKLFVGFLLDFVDALADFLDSKEVDWEGSDNGERNPDVLRRKRNEDADKENKRLDKIVSQNIVGDGEYRGCSPVEAANDLAA